MSKLVQIALRGLQFTFTLIILGLSGNMVALATNGNPSIINYSVFTAVFAFITLFYQIGVLFTEALIIFPILPAIMDGLNVIFFLCGGIAFAAYLPPHNCSDPDFYNTTVTAGATNNEQRCREGQAVIAFQWFDFAAFVASLALVSMSARSSGANLRGGIGGIRRGGPNMSQV